MTSVRVQGFFGVLQFVEARESGPYIHNTWVAHLGNAKQLRTHTGARPYSCNEPGCNKSFARPDQLARHMNVHKKKAPEPAVTAVAAGK